MNNIKYVSFFFKILFVLAFVLMPVTTVVSWVYAPNAYSLLNGMINLSSIPEPYLNVGPHATAILHTMSPAEKVTGFLLSTIPLALKLFIVYSMIKLFSLFEEGEIFSLNTVKHIRNSGYALVVDQALTPFYQFAMGFVLTRNNPPGFRFAAISLDQTNFGIVLIALFVILISWIMAEACKLSEEQQLTV